MKHISFFGAAGTVTGSSYLLKVDTGKGIVIDMGLFQGNADLERYNTETIPFSPNELDAVFLTHAHLDHSGRLPLLRQLGYRGPIYMTEPTKALLQLTLLDAVHVAKEHQIGMLLYNEQDVSWVLSKAVAMPYDKPVQTTRFSVMFRDAGHILGSAFLEVYCLNSHDTISKIIFSGDIGNFPEPLLKHTEFPSQADIVIMESTYGDRIHSHESPTAVLSEEIQAVEQSSGTLLIPAFSIERSQELLHVIDQLKKNKQVKEQTPIFLDSTLAIHVTRIYQHYRSLYCQDLKDQCLVDDPFDFPGLTMVENPHESKIVASLSGPKVVIAGSGMMNGGRILRHAKETLGLENTRLLFVGFQAEGTLGRELLEGAKTVTIDNVTIPVKAHIRKSSGMSSHADQPKLLTWLSHIKGVTDVCLVHGEDLSRSILAAKIKELPHSPNIVLPYKNETYSFGEPKPTSVQVGSSARSRRK